MKYICNKCGKVFNAEDITIHYTTGEKGLEIVFRFISLIFLTMRFNMLSKISHFPFLF